MSSHSSLCLYVVRNGLLSWNNLKLFLAIAASKSGRRIFLLVVISWRTWHYICESLYWSDLKMPSVLGCFWSRYIIVRTHHCRPRRATFRRLILQRRSMLNNIERVIRWSDFSRRLLKLLLLNIEQRSRCWSVSSTSINGFIWGRNTIWWLLLEIMNILLHLNDRLLSHLWLRLRLFNLKFWRNESLLLRIRLGLLYLGFLSFNSFWLRCLFFHRSSIILFFPDLLLLCWSHGEIVILLRLSVVLWCDDIFFTWFLLTTFLTVGCLSLPMNRQRWISSGPFHNNLVLLSLILVTSLQWRLFLVLLSHWVHSN